MDKIQISNRINRLGCGHELLYCTRVYFNARVYPTGWVEMEWFLNITFYLIRGEKNHIRASWLYEQRLRRRKNNEEETKTSISSERETQMSEDWEQSFLPFGEGGIVPSTDFVTCDYCNADGLLSDMKEVRKYTNNEPINLRFCGDGCEQEYYLNHLREVDGR